jgi:glycosyltransferase involved in cell wall biosynthesis
MMTKCVARICNQIITTSQNSRKDLMKYLKIDISKISVIYTFIPPLDPVIRRQNLEIDKEVKAVDGTIIDINKIFFLTVAALQPAKNIEGLLRAFKIFKQTHKNYYLYVVGNKGRGYKQMYMLAEELQLSENVLFTGFVDDANLSKLYEKCFAVAYFSFYEGFGIPPLEGFYHGKACVASNISSIPEVVGNAGILADPYDIDDMANAMEQFINQKLTLEKNIQAQIDMFNPREQTINFLELLRNGKY